MRRIVSSILLALVLLGTFALAVCVPDVHALTERDGYLAITVSSYTAYQSSGAGVTGTSPYLNVYHTSVTSGSRCYLAQDGAGMDYIGYWKFDTSLISSSWTITSVVPLVTYQNYGSITGTLYVQLYENGSYATVITVPDSTTSTANYTGSDQTALHSLTALQNAQLEIEYNENGDNQEPQFYYVELQITYTSASAVPLILIGIIALVAGAICLVVGIGFFWRSRAQEKIPPPPPPAIGEQKYCRFCGSENKSDASYCEKCGKPLG
jgi:hypothetical protein